MSIHLSPAMLREVQLTELELLEEVDRICRKNDIHYNIIAGTMLGAVRHKGFIPWDDDADVAFLREEYEKFREAAERDLDRTRFYFQDHRNTPGYRWGYGKLRRKDTLFLREHQEHMPYEQGIFIDLFPLDNVSEFWPLRAAQNFQCFLVRKALWSKVGKKADKNPLKRLLYRACDRIPEKKILACYDRMTARAEKRPRKTVRILLFPCPNRDYTYYRRWYETGEEILFEGKPFSGIRDWDDYLRFKFGNYMELPPESGRKVHPVSRLRLLSEGTHDHQ